MPTPANLPFQVLSGSQTSNRICDSLVGEITPATRQNGGRLLIGFVEFGGVKEPEVTSCAALIAVWGSFCSTRAAHAVSDEVCAETREIEYEQKARTANTATDAPELACDLMSLLHLRATPSEPT